MVRRSGGGSSRHRRRTSISSSRRSWPKIHAIPRERLPFLPDVDLFGRLYEELDLAAEPHPAIEYGLAWCRERLPLDAGRGSWDTVTFGSAT